ncbi:MAG: TetR family transcriptional regulator [Acidimicrobiales bacterium]|nr:TetR family transcriptional regulator [Acidimicrobiales bacterium]
MSTNALEGLRARKKERTRTDLTEAGLRLFAERGFDGVTVEDIAAAVDVSTRTFYRYFPSKEDLLLGDFDELLDTLRRAFLAQPPDLPVMAAVRGALLELSQTYEGLATESLRKARIVDATPSLRVRQAERQSAWDQILGPLVAARIGDEGEPSLRAQIIAGCALSAMRVAFARWRVDGGQARFTDLLAEALDLLGSSFGEDPSTAEARSGRARRR